MRLLLLGLVLMMAAADAVSGGAVPTVGPGFQSWPLPTPAPSNPGFTLLPPEQTGVFFTNTLAESRSRTNTVLLNGSGVAAGDVDGDGRVDLYFCSLDGPNKLYRNLGNWRFEDITDSAGVGCPGIDATGAAFADIDGDGDLDLLVNSIGGGTHLFINDGHGHFHPSPKSPELNAQGAGTSLALADMDGDGWLDLYVTNYRPMFFFLDKPETRYSIRMIDGQPQVTMIDGRPLTDPEFTNRFVFQIHTAEGKLTLSKEEVGEVDQLYRNTGEGAFVSVPFTNGSFQDEDGKPLSEPPRDWGLSVMFRDLNGDGAPDLYICNDFRTPDRVWLNDGHGHFRALPRLAIRQTCLSAMAMDVADVNRDGYFDIFTADMLSSEHVKRLNQRTDLRPEILAIGEIDTRPQFSRNMLQLNRGDGTYAEIAQFSGIEASDWTWTPLFLDVDLDGYEDLLVGNGFERDSMNRDVQSQIDMFSRQRRLRPQEKFDLRRLYPHLNTPNRAFRNLGNCRFGDTSKEWGFNATSISQGMCLADLDNDGDLDVVANNMNGPAGLYRNNSPAPRVAIRLKGRTPNTRGIGAKIEVLGGPVYQSQEMICGGRYCSSDDPMRVFAAGSLTNRLRIIVTWRNGRRSVVPDAEPNRLYAIEESGAEQSPEPAWLQPPLSNSASLPGTPARSAHEFEDVSPWLNHSHHEVAFDDFDRQPLLPHKLSQLGPGVCWLDLDGDGWDDLIVGSGRGGQLAVFRNHNGTSFEALPQGNQPVSADQLGLAGCRLSETNAQLLVAESNYEDGLTSQPAVQAIDFTPAAHTASVRAAPSVSGAGLIQTAVAPAVPGFTSAAGPIALADIAGDGSLDLFVGGRVVPARYPEPASSRVFRRHSGHFELDQANTEVLAKVGLVSGAVFSDLDGDGLPELILACEWGPIRVFKNEHGKLKEATRALGLDRFVGWWNGVAVGDFDGDGRMDIAASNWGRNSPYETYSTKPLRLYYGDFNGDGGVQLLEAYFDPGLRQIVPWRRLDEANRSLPFLNARFSSFQAFAEASVEQILGDRVSQAHILQANWLETTVFLNRTNHFDPVVLPPEAQIAPAFGVCVGDLDGDGAEDIFLSQNFFAVRSEQSRYDAGRGLWLRGDGHGHFQAVSGGESGLLVYGEQRGAALCDFDHDGRLDLVVTENGAQTRLYRNRTARPGLRVRLEGPRGNRTAVGASMRLRFGQSEGPRREIHAGSGYLSQDGAVQVLGTPRTPSELEIQWPGGRTSRVPVRPGDVEIVVRAESN